MNKQEQEQELRIKLLKLQIEYEEMRNEHGRMRIEKERQQQAEEREQREKMRSSELKHLDDMIAIETLKYSMEESSTKKKAIQIRISVLELRKEQFIEGGEW